MEKNSNGLMNEMRIEVSQRRIVKLIEAKNIIKEVIHYDPIEKSKYKTIVNMIDEAIVDELKVQENIINKPTNKIENITNPKLKEHMKNIGNKNQDLLNAIKAARSEGFIDKDQVLTIDEAIKLMTGKVKEINDIWERVEIKDGFYSDEFHYDIRRALITIAVIRALGIGKDAERYLGAVVK